MPIDSSGLTLRVRDRSVSTSGLLQRPGHIRDPRTGRSAQDVGTVTVIAESAAEADAWSTALFVSGLDALPEDFSGCAVLLAPEESGQAPRWAGDCSAFLAEENAL